MCSTVTLPHCSDPYGQDESCIPATGRLCTSSVSLAVVPTFNDDMHSVTGALSRTAVSRTLLSAKICVHKHATRLADSALHLTDAMSVKNHSPAVSVYSCVSLQSTDYTDSCVSLKSAHIVVSAYSLQATQMAVSV